MYPPVWKFFKQSCCTYINFKQVLLPTYLSQIAIVVPQKMPLKYLVYVTSFCHTTRSSFTKKKEKQEKTCNNWNWLKSGHIDRLQTNVIPKIIELEGWNCAQMKALENIFQTVPNFFIFEQFFTEICKKEGILCRFASHGATAIKSKPKKSIFEKSAPKMI